MGRPKIYPASRSAPRARGKCLARVGLQMGGTKRTSICGSLSPRRAFLCLHKAVPSAPLAPAKWCNLSKFRRDVSKEGGETNCSTRLEIEGGGGSQGS